MSDFTACQDCLCSYKEDCLQFKNQRDELIRALRKQANAFVVLQSTIDLLNKYKDI